MTVNGDIKYSDLSNFTLLGRGIFGIVYKALYLGTEVAVKECLSIIDQPGYSVEKYFNREVTILKECRHPNIVQYMGTCIHDNKFFIVTEYIKNDNLKTWITERLDELTWKLRINFAIDIAKAMAYLHSKNIIHRDMKPENLLITENGRVKICDFGFSRFDARTEEERRHLSYCGTEAYMAPEIILCMDFDMSVDIFGYGVILCEMIAGNIAEKAYKRKIPGFEIDTEDIYSYANKDPQCPEKFVELAIQCTDYTRQKRPSWIEIINILNEIDENIYDNYNIGIIPASELLSNDFFIPISPMIKGQSVDNYNKTASIKSLNIDVDEEKVQQKEKYNGRPTSPVLNTKRLSNQYYYYYAVNSPTSNNSNYESNIYHRLPAYITPPLEHSSIIAIPKEITKSNSINVYTNKNERRNSSSSNNGYNSSNGNSNNNNGNSKNNNNSNKHKVTTSNSETKTLYVYDSDLEDKNYTHSTTNDQNPMSSSDLSTSSSSSSYSISTSYSINNLSSNDVNTLINTYNNSNTSLNKIYKFNHNYSNGNNNGSNSNSRKETALDKCQSENKRILFNEMIFNTSTTASSSSTTSETSQPSDNNKKIMGKTSNYSENSTATTTTNATINATTSTSSTTLVSKPYHHSKIPIIIRSKNSFRKNKNSSSTEEKKENIKFSNNNNESINSSNIEKNEGKNNLKKKSSINYKNKKSNKKVTIKDIDINNIRIIEETYSGIHHRFSINYFPSLSKCNVCHRRMTLVKRYLSCDDCDFHCHAKCSSLAPFTCKPRK